ncbi:MAG TPA: ATP-binding cassette domain-containing protein, partial [Vicinamibacterales bacterium]|nr:ATP-binding cassette domain-containing protein [Vicinamibacterales bacterium]
MSDALRVRLSQELPVPLDVTLSCEPGKVVALFGPSGSGKTTILRSIAGLSTPKSGRVTIGGDTWLDTEAGVNVPPHRRQAGLVFQEYALFPHLTALGNVTIPLSRLPRDARRRRALELLELVHLGD